MMDAEPDAVLFAHQEKTMHASSNKEKFEHTIDVI
jgi:hypothetical protein